MNHTDVYHTRLKLRPFSVPVICTLCLERCLKTRYYLRGCFCRSYALPTKTTEVMLVQEQGTKMYVDAVLKTHERVVQVKLSPWYRECVSGEGSPNWLCYSFLCLAEQFERHTVPSFHGRSSKESARGRSTFCERGEFISHVKVMDLDWLIYSYFVRALVRSWHFIPFSFNAGNCKSIYSVYAFI